MGIGGPVPITTTGSEDARNLLAGRRPNLISHVFVEALPVVLVQANVGRSLPPQRAGNPKTVDRLDWLLIV